MDKSITSRNAPKVSVIIPAYNQALYVSEAVQSVLAQTYPNFEVVVVNDGSTDDTSRILANIQDPRVKVIWQPNAGLSAARNTGIRESTAPLVTFLDADDYFLPEKLAVQSEFLESHSEIGMVSGGIQTIDREGHLLKQTIKQPGSIELPGLLFGNPFTATSVLIRREWIELAGLFDETLRACEDWDLWQRMAYAGCQYAWIEHIVVAYRYHPGQMTREADRMRQAIFAVLDKFFSQPDLPEYLKASKNKAYASAFVHSAAHAYHARNYDNGGIDLGKAIDVDPAFKKDHYRRLVEMLVGWSEDPRSTKPAIFLLHIADNLPPGLPGLKRQIQRATADVLLGPLFCSSRDARRNSRKDILKAIFYKPDWLLNRGVLRMLADAWLI